MTELGITLAGPGVDRRPILVGEDNPYGPDPSFALYPAPAHSAGGRLCRDVLGLRRSRYLAAFDRRNLCPSVWRTADARKGAAAVLLAVSLHQRWAILCGAKVARAFGCEPATAEVPVRISAADAGGGLVVIPHPSGRCRLWSPAAVAAVRRELALLLPSIPFGESEAAS